jgi:acyl carrier protein
MSSVIDKVRELVAEVLEIEIAPRADLDRGNGGAWDSLNHLRIVMAVEEEFAVRFEQDEVASIASLSGLAALVAERIGSSTARTA